MKRIVFPADEAVMRKLRVGDRVLVSGRIVTARDAAHKFMVRARPDWLVQLLSGTAIYHCGPICMRQGRTWRVLAAGPTTSIREEPYQADVIQRYSVRAVIGKGGMGPRTSEALQRHGAVYLHAVGGAAALLADRIETVEDVFMLEEFGPPEAFWVLRVRDFPAVVTMDTAGDSLHERTEKTSSERLERLLRARPFRA